MVQTHTWNITVQQANLLEFTASSFPTSFTLNTPGTISATIKNSGTSSVCIAGHIEARPLKPSTGTYTTIPGSQASCQALVAAGSTWTISVPVTFIRNNLTPVTQQIQAQADSTNWALGWQFRIVAEQWSAICTTPPCNTCSGTHYTGDISVESTASSIVGTIADINTSSTTYYSTCGTGSACTIVSLGVTNTGNNAGIIGYRVYDCSPATCTPNTAVTNVVWTTSNVAVGATTVIPVSVTAPTTAGAYTYGIKVWGWNETEPANYSLMLGPNGELATDTNFILGFICLAGLAGILWYTKKKKMW